MILLAYLDNNMNLKKIPFALLAMGAFVPVYADSFRIEEMRIEGEQHTSEDTIRALMPVKEGDMYTDEIGEKIVRDLHASGFYESVLLEQNGNMLIATVKERPIISDVTIKGSKTLSNDAILKRISEIRGRVAKSDDELVSQSSAKQSKQSYDEKMAAFDKSNDEENATDALSATGLGKGDFFSQEALILALRSLNAAYKEQGKNNVKITPEIQPLSNNRVAITIDVDEGETTRVKHIEFEGNEHFSDATLSRQIGLTDGTLFSWLSKSNVFSWEKARQDKARLESFYHRKGFYDFSMDLDDIERQLNDDKTRETITIKVNEGKRYRWGKFELGGDYKEVPAEQLLKHVAKLKAGKISNFDDLKVAMSAMKLDMQSAGYAYADVQAESQRVDDVVNVRLNVSSGPRVAVREINITGNTKTRDEVLRREMRQMESATYDQRKINRSAQRLRQLGYFENVEVKSKPTSEDERQVDLDVVVKERDTGSLNASAGWSQDDGMVLAGNVSQANLFGTGKSGSLSVSRSKVRQSANMSFSDPYFTPDGASMSYSLFGNNYNPYKQNNSPRSYKITRFGGQAVMGIPITEYDRVNLGLGVEHIKVGLFSQSPARYRRYVDEHGASNWIYKGILSWYRDTTDDAYWPTKGYSISLNAESALPGSGLEYYQASHQQTWYFPLNRNFTLMLNGQLGYSGRYGKTRNVPFIYAQTGGGLGSVRGFETGSLGPKAYDYDIQGYRTTETYGGNYVANLNAELLFPFPGMKDNKSVRLSMFADAGSVWDGKTYTSSTYDPNTNPYSHGGYYGTGTHKSSFKEELRYSAGVALTWISPMGPIKLSYAYPIKKKDGDEVQRFQFQLGTVF